MSIWSNPPTGFRMMIQDPFAVAACLVAVVWAWPYIGEWALVAPFVLGNFFLFCNVFRLHGAVELIWSGIFIANSAAWLWLSPSLAGIFLCQMPITFGVIAHTVSRPDYRGVMSGRLLRMAA